MHCERAQKRQARSDHAPTNRHLRLLGENCDGLDLEEDAEGELSDLRDREASEQSVPRWREGGGGHTSTQERAGLCSPKIRA